MGNHLGQQIGQTTCMAEIHFLGCIKIPRVKFSTLTYIMPTYGMCTHKIWLVHYVTAMDRKDVDIVPVALQPRLFEFVGLQLEPFLV